MALLKIPTRSDLPAFSQKIELDGTVFTLKMRYNERYERWILDILTQEETPIRVGIVMLTNIPLLFQYSEALLPPGEFICLHKDGISDNAKRDDLGDTVNLYYDEA